MGSRRSKTSSAQPPRTDRSPHEPVAMSRLGELLLKRSLITQDQLVSATTDQQQQGGILAAHLVRLGVVNEEQLVSHLQKEYRLPIVDPMSLEIASEVLQLIPVSLAWKHHLLPLQSRRIHADARHGRSLEPGRDQRGQVPHRLRRPRRPRQAVLGPQGDRSFLRGRKRHPGSARRRSRARTSSSSATNKRSI